MKKLVSLLLAGMLTLSLAACGGQAAPEQSAAETPASSSDAAASNSEAASSTASGAGKSAILIVNGNLGDLGFFDSANRGMMRLKDELGMEVKVIETGDDESKWEPALADAAEEEVDYVIAVSPSMVEPIQAIAPLYPEKTFLLIDNTVDYSAADLSNVYCATFKQNEGSFLAGAVAALVAGDSGKIGFVGGMDIPPINDFLVGYIEGAKAVNPDIKVIASYTGDYYDPAKGKEHGIVQVNQGAEVVFPAAGPTGLGTISALAEAKKYVIGVDSDQSAGYAANGDTATAQQIVTSMMKNVGDTIFRAIQLHMEDKLLLGESESLGILENGVGLAKNDVYLSVLTEEQQKKMEEIEAKVVSGEITVSTAIGMSQDELNQIRSSVAP